jgi:hypothetical protein
MWRCSFVNKTSKVKAKAKDFIVKAQAEDKNFGLKAKAKD